MEDRSLNTSAVWEAATSPAGGIVLNPARLQQLRTEETWVLIRDASGEVAAVCGAIEQLVERLAGSLELKHLVRAGDEVRSRFLDLLDAMEILYDRVPLASEFPNGDPVPEVATPRQVVYLARHGPAQRPYTGWPIDGEAD